MGMELIEHIEVGSGGAASITFSSIAADWTDLKIVLSMRTVVDGASAWWDVNVNFNGLSTNQTQRVLFGSGSSATSISETRFNVRTSDSGNTANTFGNASLYIPNYAATAAKSISMDVVSENNATAAFQAIQAGLWNSTAAITSITFIPASGNLAEYSTASLYGII
jgi:hypothetical protein